MDDSRVKENVNVLNALSAFMSGYLMQRPCVVMGLGFGNFFLHVILFSNQHQQTVRMNSVLSLLTNVLDVLSMSCPPTDS